MQVAVRTRPFNKREKARNAKVIIAMNGPTTVITDPGSGEEKKFTFDYSYWSFDGYKEEKNGYCSPDSKHPNGKKFCDQVRKDATSRKHSLRTPKYSCTYFRKRFSTMSVAVSWKTRG